MNTSLSKKIKSIPDKKPIKVIFFLIKIYAILWITLFLLSDIAPSLQKVSKNIASSSLGLLSILILIISINRLLINKISKNFSIKKWYQAHQIKNNKWKFLAIIIIPLTTLFLTNNFFLSFALGYLILSITLKLEKKIAALISFNLSILLPISTIINQDKLIEQISILLFYFLCILAIQETQVIIREKQFYKILTRTKND